MGLPARAVASGLGPDLRPRLTANVHGARLLISAPRPCLVTQTVHGSPPFQGRTIWALRAGAALSLVPSCGGSPLHVNSHPLPAASPNPARQLGEPLPALSSPLRWGPDRRHCGCHGLVLLCWPSSVTRPTVLGWFSAGVRYKPDESLPGRNR